MILVDTSVLIDYLKGVSNRKAVLFQEMLDRGLPYGICDIVFLEVLQGARDEREFRDLQEYLESLRFHDLLFGRTSFERAARIQFDCRRSGRTIRSTVDVLIAEIAIENELYLLHNDSDFDAIASAVEGFKSLERLELS